MTAACPRTGSAWTSTGNSHEPTGLKHRPHGTIRVVPIPPVLVSMLRRHLSDHGTTPDGRLFRGARGGMLILAVVPPCAGECRFVRVVPVLIFPSGTSCVVFVLA
jgi:hypothetical protein